MESTAEIIRETISRNMESTILPEQLMHLIQEADGKQLTKRLTDKWGEVLGAELYIRKQYGMTHIDVNGYWRQQYGKTDSENHQFDFLIAHSEKHVYLNADLIRDHNARHLSAADKRNHRRELELENQQTIDDLAKAIDDYKDAKERLDALIDCFEDNYRIEKVFGLDDK